MTKSFIEVETMADRSNIPPGDKIVGLICHVKENSTYWEWDGSSWIDITPKTGDLSDIRDAIVALDANKASKSELLGKSDIGHEHSEYALVDHTHTGIDGTLVSKDEFSRHIEKVHENESPVDAVHLTRDQAKSLFAAATETTIGRVKPGGTLYVKPDGTLDVKNDVYRLGEAMIVIDDTLLGQNEFSLPPYIASTLEVFINGSRISDDGVEEFESDASGRFTKFRLSGVNLRKGDVIIAAYFQGSALAFGNHGHEHSPEGSDPIAFAEINNLGGLMKTEYLKQIIDNTNALDAKVNVSETVKGRPAPNRLLYLDQNGKLPASITGTAENAVSLRDPRTIGGWTDDITGARIPGAIFDGCADIDADEMNVARKIHNHASSDVTSMENYSKDTSVTKPSKIEQTDSLNEAIGKLERVLDFKSDTDHKHQSSHVIGMAEYDKSTIDLNNNYLITKGEDCEDDNRFTVDLHRQNISIDDTLNTAIAKLDVAADLTEQMIKDALFVGKQYTNERIDILLGGVELDFDTLKELADAIGNDTDFHTNVYAAIAKKADIESPTFTGVPRADTADVSDNSTQLATTEFVHAVGQGKVDTHKVVIATEDGLGHIKSGGDIDVDPDTGVVEVRDNSHNHIWTNITDRPKREPAEIEHAVDLRHHHDNKDILDDITAAYTGEMRDKLNNIELFANYYELPAASHDYLGGIKVGNGLIVDSQGTLSLGDLPGDRTPVVTVEEEFVAIENQTVFILTKGRYIRGCGQIEVFINGSKVPLKDIGEYIDCDRFALPPGLSEGDRVLVRYTILSRIIADGHFNTHLPGGLDEIPAAKPDVDFGTGLMSGVDKIKLDSLALNSTSVEESGINGNILINGLETNIYTHPDTDVIRHVTDADKDNWNGKADKTYVDDIFTDIAHPNKAELDTITAERMENWDKGGDGRVIVDSTAPAAPSLNMLWVDIS